MSNVRTAAVIARRDFIATVMSRTFLLFLIAPIFPLLFGLVFGSVGSDVAPRPDHLRALAITAGPETMMRIATAHERLQSGVAPASSIALEPVELLLPDEKSISALLRERDDLSALMIVAGADATLYAEPRVLERMAPYAGLLLNEAARERTLQRLGIASIKTPQVTSVALGPPPVENKRTALVAQVAQTLLFVLTLMLAGVLLSNFIEEKGNKVIEVLAAAAPMPAVFTGKLFAMLGSSIVGVAVWGFTAAVGFVMLSDEGLVALPAPEIGWPAFLILGILYFATNYLLVGALLLGIGAQASSVRQVQTISLPVTMAQLLLYGLASAALKDTGSIAAIAAAVFPYSSPLAMIAYAAREPEIWPHVVALFWQALWVAITVSVAAGWFKRGVLKSGPSRRRSERMRRRPVVLTPPRPAS